MTGKLDGKSSSIDISRLPPGLYVLRSGIENQKIQIIK
jgi:hypothetical protein